MTHADSRSRRHTRARRRNSTPPPPSMPTVTVTARARPVPPTPRDPQAEFRTELTTKFLAASDKRRQACYLLLLAIHEQHRATGIGATEANFTRLQELMQQVDASRFTDVSALWAEIDSPLVERTTDTVLGIVNQFVSAHPVRGKREALKPAQHSVRRSIQNARGKDNRQRAMASAFSQLQAKL